MVIGALITSLIIWFGYIHTRKSEQIKIFRVNLPPEKGPGTMDNIKNEHLKNKIREVNKLLQETNSLIKKQDR